MDAQAGMLARLFEHSMGLGPEWRVEDVWFESPETGDEELHIRVGRAPGNAVSCPECGARCGVYDARERAWRHLDIWQFRTVVHCRAPRADCPEHGPRTVRMPWELRPNSHFTALFEAQVLVMAMSGMTVKAISAQVGESDSRIWAMLGRAVAEAMPGAAQTVDRFHVMQLLTKALDKTRCAEEKSWEEKGRLLGGTKYVWLKRPENLTERQAAKRASLASEHLLTARACAMVEAVRAVYSCATREEASAELDRALSWIMHSNVPLMKVAARTIRDEREGVLNWFSVRATNGFLEGMNSIIQSLKRASRGFRNVGHFTTMIFLRLGRLDFSAQLASGCATH